MHALIEMIVNRARRLRYNLGRLRVLFLLPSRGICAEVGVWKGDLSERVLKLRRPQQFHLVDPWLFEPEFPCRWYGGDAAKNQEDMDSIERSVRRRFAGDSVVIIHRNKSIEAAEQFPDGYFDWIYIDGDHTSEAVFNDLQAWFKKLKVRGVLALDDYDWRDEQGLYSIRYAVERFLEAHENLKARKMWGQFVITRKTFEPSRSQSSFRRKRRDFQNHLFNRIDPEGSRRRCDPGLLKGQDGAKFVTHSAEIESLK
jgi:Methyltransferase domain